MNKIKIKITHIYEGSYKDKKDYDRLMEACEQEFPELVGVGGNGYKIDYIKTEIKTNKKKKKK